VSIAEESEREKSDEQTKEKLEYSFFLLNKQTIDSSIKRHTTSTNKSYVS
jgi:hypothetical protein